jgi:hypothetical protein
MAFNRVFTNKIYNDFGQIPPTFTYTGTLTANAEQHFNVPGSSPNFFALFNYSGAALNVAFGSTATLPTSTVSASKTELNPKCRYVSANQLISLITSDSGNPQVEISFWAANGQP